MWDRAVIAILLKVLFPTHLVSCTPIIFLKNSETRCSFGYWEVMEIDNAVYQGLGNLGRKVFQLGQRNVLDFVWENSAIS